MFKKKVVKEVKEDVHEVFHVEGATKVIHDELACAGCGKVINVVTVTEDGKNFHNQYCLNDYQNKLR